MLLATDQFAGFFTEQIAGLFIGLFTDKLAGRRPDKSDHIPVSFPAYLPTGLPPTLPTYLSAGLSTNASYVWVVLKMIQWN